MGGARGTEPSRPPAQPTPEPQLCFIDPKTRYVPVSQHAGAPKRGRRRVWCGGSSRGGSSLLGRGVLTASWLGSDGF